MKGLAGTFPLRPQRATRMAVWALLLLVVVNVGMCLIPDWPLARLSDPPSATRDPALAAVLNFLRGVREGNAATVEANEIDDYQRPQIEWTLINNVDVFTAAADAAVFADNDDEPMGGVRQFWVRMATPLGAIPAECTVQRQADGRWLVSDLIRPTNLGGDTAASSYVSRVQTLLSFETPVPIAVRRLILLRINSDAFRRQALADAGLSGIVGPSLVGQLWAVGWSKYGLELYSGWSEGAGVPRLYARARMAPAALSAALDCRACAEAAAACLVTSPPVPTRQDLLCELMVTGDDDIVLPTLDQLVATAQNEPARQDLRKLRDYLRAHPATPAQLADAAGYERIAPEGAFDGPHSRYTDGIASDIAARLAAAGIATTNQWPLRRAIHNDREKAFEQIFNSRRRGK